MCRTEPMSKTPTVRSFLNHGKKKKDSHNTYNIVYLRPLNNSEMPSSEILCPSGISQNYQLQQ